MRPGKGEAGKIFEGLYIKIAKTSLMRGIAREIERPCPEDFRHAWRMSWKMYEVSWDEQRKYSRR